MLSEVPDSEAHTGGLYDAPHLYRLGLGQADTEELAFYDRLLPERGRVVSLGCGEGRLESRLSSADRRFFGYDRALAMVQAAACRDAIGNYVVARMEAPPFHSGARFDAALAGMLSFSYLADQASLLKATQWLATVMGDGAIALLDVACAHRPQRLQGIEERHVEEGATYCFRYLDAELPGPFGSILHSRIEIAANGERAVRDAPLMVFTPIGVRRLFAQTGFGALTFFAPHDLGSETDCPPMDCRRAVIRAVKPLDSRASIAPA